MYNRILLIDDSAPSNFFHRKVLQKKGCDCEILEVSSASEALTYLSSKTNDRFPIPDIIFLDVNMPRMNGWEFIEEFLKFSEEIRGSSRIYMLTSSVNPDDMSKADLLDCVSGFIPKQFFKEKIDDILIADGILE